MKSALSEKINKHSIENNLKYTHLKIESNEKGFIQRKLEVIT